MIETGRAERSLNVTRRASGALLGETSEALQEAAGNLLDKAVARLQEGDEVRARALVERALHLPYDEFEKIRPAVWWLELEVSTQFSDEVELAAEGDSGWLARAELLLSEASEPMVAAVVRAALNDIGSEFRLPQRESRWLNRLIAGEPFGREPLSEIDDIDELTVAVLGVLRMLNRQAELFAEG
ncbi:hypothetical protein [Kineosporia sp. NBRC 101731]|uniref:hypothetical protein n=1 Tax=Kineosporia sp. NBRC 101731 TaxID=3032199 RepID=UPI0024A101B4|nr:hypothetical protein [Kineosporia sp. NBRC 101731]GLY31850.1 hypothetical protein Kisp02_52150 [Kineosporia sp. NBRC 101731]